MYDVSAARDVFVYSCIREWESRTAIRWRSTRDDDKPRTMSTVIEGIRGDSGLTAIDISHTVLLTENDTHRLLEGIRADVFPHARAEDHGRVQNGQWDAVYPGDADGGNS